MPRAHTAHAKAKLPRPGWLCGCVLAAGLAQAATQPVSNPAHKGEFPGLNIMPAGSVVRNISLPRYEGHRVSSLMVAERMEVVSPRLVKLSKVRSSLFALSGEVTVIEVERAEYNFDTEKLSTDKRVTLTDPRFRADGTSAVFSNARQQGLVRGPVHTLIHTEMLRNSPPAATKP